MHSRHARWSSLLVVLALLSTPASAVGAENAGGTTAAIVHPGADAATGPLRVLARNPRYFSDGSGKAIFLAGSHTWSNLEDLGHGTPHPFDYAAYLQFMASHDLNFMRLWTSWLPHGGPKQEPCCEIVYGPFPWRRIGPGNASDGGPQFDFTKFDPAYFDRLRTRVLDAGRHGIYVSIMLFNGYEFEFATTAQDGNPFASGNNVNDVSCPGTCPTDASLISPLAWSYEEAYMRKVIDTVNDLDNVLYEVANEAGSYSMRWQDNVVAFVKRYEATLPKQHPVGITFLYKGGTDAALFDSPADWISPSTPLPPDQKGRKVVINDTDHTLYYTQLQELGQNGQRAWAWENFTHGNNLAFMDPYRDVWLGRNAPRGGDVDPYWDELRKALGDIHRYADRVDLANMTPQPELADGNVFWLASPGSQYLVFEHVSAPTDSRLDRITNWLWRRTFVLPTIPGTYAYEWFDPSTHAIAESGTVTVDSAHSFTAPFSGDAVLWLHK